VAVPVEANRQSLVLENVLLDTGSAATVFKTDELAQIGVQPEALDVVRAISGVGGHEFVVEKKIDTVYVGDLAVTLFPIQLSAMNDAPEFDGILGLDFLLRTNAVVDFGRLEIRRG
jgi:predicted aspartyl protease